MSSSGTGIDRVRVLSFVGFVLRFARINLSGNVTTLDGTICFSCEVCVFRARLAFVIVRLKF